MTQTHPVQPKLILNTPNSSCIFQTKQDLFFLIKATLTGRDLQKLKTFFGDTTLHHSNNTCSIETWLHHKDNSYLNWVELRFDSIHSCY